MQRKNNFFENGVIKNKKTNKLKTIMTKNEENKKLPNSFGSSFKSTYFFI